LGYIPGLNLTFGLYPGLSTPYGHPGLSTPYGHPGFNPSIPGLYPGFKPPSLGYIPGYQHLSVTSRVINTFLSHPGFNLSPRYIPGLSLSPRYIPGLYSSGGYSRFYTPRVIIPGFILPGGFPLVLSLVYTSGC